MSKEFDLTPDPRVLQMLGEINLDQWKCVAELVDNSVDAFVNARRGSVAVEAPSISVSLPTHDREDASVAVRDNGPGMTIAQLENAAKAGWSGNGPLDSLGLFGMGFNIATARLGMVTEVYTTRAGDPEWTGLRIDLGELRRTRSYHTPRLTRPKPDPRIQGTEIKVHRLKADQRAYFASRPNQQRLRRQLSRVYAPLLLSKDSTFKLDVGGQIIQPKRHCIWDPQRFTLGADGRPVHAVETVDLSLSPRRYCSTCMIAFTEGDVCPSGGATCSVVEIKRRLHGWIGLQRYLHEEDFGIDLVRNGRVIEVRNKELFVWNGDDRPEREYPIDDPRNRGRFVGELHIDHCRVSYTKDRFERDDPAWQEMLLAVRGEGPLQPNKARQKGYGPQDAVLNRLFQAFRRSSPQGKTGRWSKIFVVKDNDRAIEMAELFDKGDPDYQTDEKWYTLVEEADQSTVGGVPDPSSPVNPAVEMPEGFLDDAQASPADASASAASEPTPATPPPPRRQRIEALSRTYKHPLVKVEFNIEAFVVESVDPDLPKKAPWTIKLDDAGTRTHKFLFVADHPVFRSITMTPIDALLVEIAFKVHEFLRETMPASADFATILAELRREYGLDTDLDSREIIALADSTLRDIALSISRHSQPCDYQALFNALPETARDSIRRRVASSGAATLQIAIESGEFMRHADAAAIRAFVRSNPELFFDGHHWDQPYTGLDFGSVKINDEARGIVLDRFDTYLADAVWLATQSSRDLDRHDRDELTRASLSLRLLRADGAV